MLKEAVRRLLWLGPTLFLVTLPVFWAMARAEARVAPDVPGAPLFFNPAPLGARERALASMSRVARGGPDAADAAVLLDRQGGAALPHVLSSLDALAPEARGRVALSLAPVAKRMQIGGSGEFDSPEGAALFWSRYWEEHAIDFRQASMQRDVRRFAEHPSALRFGEVTAVDTFALEELILAMRPLGTPADVTRLRHICEAAAHVSGNAWLVPDGSSVAAARDVVERWENFWFAHRTDYVTLSGTRRLGATLVETRYGNWLERTWRRGLALSRGDTALDPDVRTRLATTLSLVLFALLVGYPLAWVLGALASLGRPSTASRVVLGTSVGAIFACVFGIASALRDHGFAAAATAMVLVSLPTAWWRQRALQSRLVEMPHLRTARAVGASTTRIVLRNARLAAPSLFALAVADLSTLLTAAFVVERAWSLRGLGEDVLGVARSGNMTSLMELALALAFALGLAQIGADLFLQWADPRAQRTRPRPRGTVR